MRGVCGIQRRVRSVWTGMPIGSDASLRTPRAWAWAARASATLLARAPSRYSTGERARGGCRRGRCLILGLGAGPLHLDRPGDDANVHSPPGPHRWRPSFLPPQPIATFSPNLWPLSIILSFIYIPFPPPIPSHPPFPPLPPSLSFAAELPGSDFLCVPLFFSLLYSPTDILNSGRSPSQSCSFVLRS